MERQRNCLLPVKTQRLYVSVRKTMMTMMVIQRKLWEDKIMYLKIVRISI